MGTHARALRPSPRDLRARAANGVGGCEAPLINNNKGPEGLSKKPRSGDYYTNSAPNQRTRQGVHAPPVAGEPG